MASLARFFSLAAMLVTASAQDTITGTLTQTAAPGCPTASDHFRSCAKSVAHSAFFWAKFTPSTTVVAATVRIIVNNSTNSSSTTTIYNTLPAGIDKPATNENGTRVHVVTSFAATGGVATVAYPTEWADYDSVVQWSGSLYTRSTCTTVEEAAYITLPPHPPIANPNFTHTPDPEDPNGYFYAPSYYSYFAPIESYAEQIDESALRDCGYGYVSPPTALEGVRFLTETETLFGASTPPPESSTPPPETPSPPASTPPPETPPPPPSSSPAPENPPPAASSPAPENPPAAPSSSGAPNVPAIPQSSGQPAPQNPSPSNPSTPNPENPTNPNPNNPTNPNPNNPTNPNPENPNTNNPSNPSPNNPANPNPNNPTNPNDTPNNNTPAPPAPVPVTTSAAFIVVGDSTFTAAPSSSEFVVGSQTLTPGGTITVSGTTIGLDSTAPVVVVNGQTSSIVVTQITTYTTTAGTVSSTSVQGQEPSSTGDGVQEFTGAATRNGVYMSLVGLALVVMVWL